MKSSRLRVRFFGILWFFAGVIARFIFWELLIARVGFRGAVRRSRPERFRREAVRFRALAIRMGGVMIKVGQFLSSRLDVLPPEVTDTLADLQDEVPAETFAEIQKLAESEMEAPLTEKFAWFDQTPLAAASLGQVHRARLKGDVAEAEHFQEVVAKILRPNIEQIVEVDLSALRIVGNWLMRYRPIREHADVPALLKEFSATLREEIDYQLEAQHAEMFAENFKDDPLVHVPRVVRSRSTRRVLTLEDVYAIKITDYEAITAAGIDRGAVARRLLDTYLKQIFADGFFHADPHPGNLFVTPVPAESGSPGWKLTFVDFGMVGRLPENLRAGLRETVIAIGTRDPIRLIKSYQSLGFLLPGANTIEIENASTMVFDRFWGLSMSELRSVNISEFHDIGHRIREVMLEMPFQVPNNLLMLVRTVAILSGMCTGLDPNFNLWNQLEPYAKKLVAEQGGSTLDTVLETLEELVKTLVALPSQASRVLAQTEREGLLIRAPQFNRQIGSLERSIDRLSGSVIFTALLLGGILSFNAGNVLFGQGLLGFAGLVLLWILFAPHRRR
jgi:predicted unusual protein kinase regulating ubiquinone biosynthesis (AarF/ABC1/UbiB family)